MAKLQVILNNDIIQEIDLVQDQEYIAGRGNDVQIPMQGQRGISRQHLRFAFTENQWRVELVATYGGIIFENQNHDILELAKTMAFDAPPYKFVFIADEAAEIELDEAEPIEDALPVDSVVRDVESEEAFDLAPEIDMEEQIDASPSVFDDENTESGGQKTALIATSHLVPTLSIQYPTGETTKTDLEGPGPWVAGREPDCDIYIRNHHVSRQHFQIQKTGNEFYLFELGSSNGTYVNGELTPVDEAHQIFSGNLIEIKKVRITFQIRSRDFDKELQNVAPQLLQPVDLQLDMPSPYPLGQLEPQQVVVVGAKKQQGLPKKKKILFASVGALVLLAALFGGGSKKPQSGKADLASKEPTLSKEQREASGHHFALAQTHVRNQKYASCLNELDKVHALTPQYESSKRLEALCKNGLESKKWEEEKRRLAEERARTEQAIQEVVTRCRAKLDRFKNVTELNLCLTEAIELDPEWPDISEMRIYLESKEAQKEAARQRRLAYQRRVKAGESHYREAMKQCQRLTKRKCLKVLSKFISTEYPEISDEKSKAKRTVASINSELDKILSTALQSCKTKFQAGSHKEAYDECSKILVEDPGNSEAVSMQTEIRRDLEKQMRRLYENAIIEENYGNVEAAKEHWKKILEKDLSDGNFFLKAKSKLKKYGGV